MMFHVVFNANEAYIKYVAVLITSIIQNTDTKKTFQDFLNDKKDGYKKRRNISNQEQEECYTFHILNDGLTQESKNKLAALQKELSKMYSCQILTHHIDDAIFKHIGVPLWKGNYLTYFRLCLGDFVSKESKYCLYLDTDMLVLGDLRYLFSIDLGESIIATSNLYQNATGEYFNAGLLLVNIKKWHDEQIQQKCFNFAKKHATNIFSDQDILNAVIKNNTTLKLPLEWNYYLQTFQTDTYDIFSAHSFESFKKQVKIIHYIRPKPWMNIYQWYEHSKSKVFLYQNVINLWWDIASKTPIFTKELMDLRVQINFELATDLQRHLVGDEYLYYQVGQVLEKPRGVLGYIRIPFVLSYIEHAHKQQNSNEHLHYHATPKMKESLPYKLGESYYGGGAIHKLYFIFIGRKKLKRKYRANNPYPTS